ncbi:hypothetical protein ERIC1_1c21710 [Paenibacillus larvae subsp. larvae DSM 25719]|uniref:Uncharacterized protein n=1 Tax=Paenibacillus larvae subsp. larvae DSM 25430 TaxID=697284 RepID=V9W5H4_9BACL|nr:hypothetical protein ERIC2_c05250 [Paenibacillus larvae subsp. larvae DSM 25430]ETK28702.1 hypothetical protein ERIC1_1c21710 [Paenibacillus larvae subsp. larvae DSM 25719]
MIKLVETMISYNTRSYGSAMVSGIRQKSHLGGCMRPVIGIDVSKGESEGFIFLETCCSFRINGTLSSRACCRTAEKGV